MDVNILLKNVANLNEYTTVTQDIIGKWRNGEKLIVTNTIATALTLKKIRALEIEYLNKCDENGAACIIFEQLLSSPPSKVWGVLGKELICLLQYWLDAVRKHLINHSNFWWMFLKLILRFIGEIRTKHTTIPNLLVELTSECLFELATAAKVDDFQRQTILHSLNMVCAESAREIRFAMRTKFGDYFVKIAGLMLRSGYLPCQYSSLECLLRWLVPRHEPSLRAAAADSWLRPLCPPAAAALFLNRSWTNFYEDARDFLNALNEGNGLVTSVICRQLSIGNTVIINGSEKQQSWLDFNTSGKCVSVLLDPHLLRAFGVRDHRACESLVVDDVITETALLRRESLGLTISLYTSRAPHIRPSDINTGDERHLTIVISSASDLRTLDAAMRNTFGDKYQPLLDLQSAISQSPERSNQNGSEEDTRFSHPVEVKRRRHCGYVVKTRNPVNLSSPSSVSTSSLMHLMERLAALPQYKFDKEPVTLCAQPALSNVSELTEQDDRSNYSTAKYQPYGVCYSHKNRNTTINKTTTEIQSKSEGETVKRIPRGGRRLLSPVVSDDNSTSLLLVATAGSTNDSVINETIERLSKSKDFQEDNIINLLVQEAFLSQPRNREVSDSGINIDDKKSQVESEVIDDTPNQIKETSKKVPLKKTFTVISKSTTDDESNTEAINETPAFVNPRKNIRRTKTVVEEEKHTVDFKTIEEFFTQHVAENTRGEVVISPSLAKKINETSSETSDNFDDNFLLMNEDVNTDVEQNIFNDIAVVDCLNDMVDKVCSDFDKCTEYLFNKNFKVDIDGNEEKRPIFENKNVQTPKRKSVVTQRSRKSIKLRYRPVKKDKPRVTKKTKDITKKMSTITEHTEEDTILEEIIPETNENLDVEKKQSNKQVTELETPSGKDTDALVRRKRKLYSPKDNDIEDEIQQYTAEKSDDVPLSKIITHNISKNSKTTATCYKELEKERKKYNTRLPRNRKSKANDIEITSPRTLKMNTMFDNLKHTVENIEKIKIVERNSDVYNFTSDSEDEDFKKKKIDTRKMFTASTNIIEKKMPVRTRRAKETDGSIDEVKKTVKRKKTTKRSNKQKPDESKIETLVKANKVLVDERMREAVREDFNTSIITHQPINLEPEEIEPVITEVTQIEVINNSNNTSVSRKNAKKSKEIQDNQSNDTKATKKKANKRVKKTDILSIKKEKGLSLKGETIAISDKDDERTSSPLPGLLVESTHKYKEDINDSLTTNMLQKFKRIYKEGPNNANDSVNTQNMLSDVERFNFSAQNCVNVTEEICFEDVDKENIDSNATLSRIKKGKKVVPLKAMKTRSQKKIESKTHEIIEIVDTHNISDVHDNQIDKSIATDGITAHGVSDEDPPIETINDFQPREIQDLDQSMKDYFNKLTREIHDSKDDPQKSAEGEEVCNILRNAKEKSSNITISPVVSVKRLSQEFVHKWMPSRRTSDSDSPPPSPKKKSQTKQSSKPNIEIHCKAKSDAQSKNTSTPKTSTPDNKFLHNTFRTDGIASPAVSVKRLSFEDIRKWVPSRRTSDTDSQPSSPKHKIQTNKIKKTSPVIRRPKSIPKPVARTKNRKTPESSPDSNKLCVLPITRISLEEFNKWLPMPVSLESTQKEKDDVIKDSRRCSVMGSQSPIKVLKRKSSSPILNEAKETKSDGSRRAKDPKRKVEILEDVSINASGPSISSVNSWLRQVEPSGHTENDVSVYIRDMMQNVMERLDTTLTEINRNTSKKFVNLFVESQKKLSNQKEEQRQLHKQVAKDIIIEMVRVIDEKYADLDRKSQSMYSDYMEDMKKKAFELIRQDCKQKRDMVLLLKEDVQSAIDRIDTSRRAGLP